MSKNPPNLRPDLAPEARIAETPRRGQPTLGMVSLGCPKALVDSERILTRLRAEGYGISPDYTGADAVIVNTCGFLDSAKAESLDAIGEALVENGKVIVTGCLGAEPDYIREHHPRILAVTGPHQYERVLDAVHAAVPPDPNPYVDLLPASLMCFDLTSDKGCTRHGVRIQNIRNPHDAVTCCKASRVKAAIFSVMERGTSELSVFPCATVFWNSRRMGA